MVVRRTARGSLAHYAQAVTLHGSACACINSSEARNISAARMPRVGERIIDRASLVWARHAAASRQQLTDVAAALTAARRRAQRAAFTRRGGERSARRPRRALPPAARR